MTIDDAAATLDVTEGHLKDLLRDGKIRGKQDRRGRWVSVQGSDVRKRRQRLTRKAHRK